MPGRLDGTAHASPARMSIAPSEHPFSRSVLVVADDPGFCELLIDTLSEAGHRATIADNSGGLHLVLLRGRFDAAIVDLDNRAHDGPRSIALLRERAPATRVIVLAPFGGVPVAGAVVLRPDVAMEKPVRMGALLAAVAAQEAGVG
jgi:DNA-binding NtrC family response regulator